MGNLFKKLNEQKDINTMKTNINEEEKAKVEKKVIFENFVEDLNKDLEKK